MLARNNDFASEAARAASRATPSSFARASRSLMLRARSMATPACAASASKTCTSSFANVSFSNDRSHTTST